MHNTLKRLLHIARVESWTNRGLVCEEVVDLCVTVTVELIAVEL